MGMAIVKGTELKMPTPKLCSHLFAGIAMGIVAKQSALFGNGFVRKWGTSNRTTIPLLFYWANLVPCSVLIGQPELAVPSQNEANSPRGSKRRLETIMRVLPCEDYICYKLHSNEIILQSCDPTSPRQGIIPNRITPSFRRAALRPARLPAKLIGRLHARRRVSLRLRPTRPPIQSGGRLSTDGEGWGMRVGVSKRGFAYLFASPESFPLKEHSIQFDHGICTNLL